MIEGIKKTAGSLGSIVGGEHVQENPPLRVDDHEPSMLVLPGSSEEVAACLRVCSEAGLSVIPAGFMSWLDGGNLLRRADVVLSLRRMSRMIDYSPPDLTITVEAGTPLGDLNSAALAEGQWLPLDPPGGSGVSVGAVVSCASTGPLRFGFGTVRDYVIGLRLAHADGTLSKSGGRVVKNVAGYDMNKLYVGSFGSLAVITEATFKLRPMPDTCVTLMMEGTHLRLATVAEAALAEGLQPAASVLSSELADGPGGENNYRHTLLLRFIETEPAARHQVGRVLSLARGDATVLEDVSQERAWREHTELEGFGDSIVRVSLPLSKARGFVEEVVSSRSARFIMADLGTGIIRAALRVGEAEASGRIKALRASAQNIGGTLFIERAAPKVRETAGAWGEVGETAGLMTAIKAKFDPHGLLNPGRFVEGI
ncbi:MAG TPA: FAD-binding oxidoreductase [Blastocatellia bacterium]|nr:FAD-binding oxidoreductase [Blastocatellia bacterium]